MQVNITTKVNSQSIRRETHNGREHLVLPSYTLPANVVMNGGLYTEDEINAHYQGLEGTLAPLGHPQVKQSKAGLNRIINDVKGRKVVRALQSAMIIGSSQAALYTPIDTSTLLNSQYRELINNGVRLTARVGYTANYAVFVHDPNVPQTFRRATAQKEFLTKGFEDTRGQIDAVMRKELSV